jgi:hypothetical protein
MPRYLRPASSAAAQELPLRRKDRAPSHREGRSCGRAGPARLLASVSDGACCRYMACPSHRPEAVSAAAAFRCHACPRSMPPKSIAKLLVTQYYLALCVASRWPVKAPLLKLFRAHPQAGRIPEKDLQPIDPAVGRWTRGSVRAT